MPADDNQKLMVLIEANTKSMERQLKKLTKTTDRAMKNVSRSARQSKRGFNALERSMGGVSRIAGRLAVVLAGAFSVRELKRFMDANTRIENSLKVAGLAGEDLKKVYDALQVSAQKNAAPLEALTELYSRAALVQNELGISTQELLGFTDKVAVALRVSGKSASESSGALLQLSQALGSGVVRAEEFNSVLEGALPIAQAAAFGLEEAGGSVAKLRTLIVDGKVSSEAFFRAFEAGSSILEDKVSTAVFTTDQKLQGMQNALTVAAGQFDKATGASDLFKQGIDNATGSIASMGDAFENNAPLIQGWMDAIGEFFGGTSKMEEFWKAMLAEEATEEIGKLERQIFALSNMEGEAAAAIKLRLEARLASLTTTANEAADAINRVTLLANGRTVDADRRAGVDPNQQATVSLKDFTSPSGTGKTKKSDAERQRERQVKTVQREQQAIAELMDGLRQEISLVGASGLEYEKANAVRNLGMSATDGQIAAVEQLIETLHDEEQAYEAAINASEEFASAAFDGLTGVIDGTKSASEAMQDFVKQIARAALQATLLGEGPLAGLFGSTNSGGILGSLTKTVFNPHAGTGMPIPLGHLRGLAGGGAVAKGVPQTVGERGPEMFIPQSAGRIAPAGGRGGSSGVVQLMMSGDIEARILKQAEGQSIQIVRSSSPAIVSAAAAQSNKQLSNGGSDGAMRRFNVKPATRRAG